MLVFVGINAKKVNYLAQYVSAKSKFDRKLLLRQIFVSISESDYEDILWGSVKWTN